jgi:hypothetical protein
MASSISRANWLARLTRPSFLSVLAREIQHRQARRRTARAFPVGPPPVQRLRERRTRQRHDVRTGRLSHLAKAAERRSQEASTATSGVGGAHARTASASMANLAHGHTTPAEPEAITANQNHDQHQTRKRWVSARWIPSPRGVETHNTSSTVAAPLQPAWPLNLSSNRCPTILRVTAIP